MSLAETVVKYTGRAKTLRNALATAGVRVDDHSLVLHILRGLPVGYASIKTVMENFPGTLRLAQATARPLNVKKQIQAGNGGGRTLAAQAFSAGDSQAQRDQERKEKIKCFYCGKAGHVKRRCLKRKVDLRKGGGEDKEARMLAFAVTGEPEEDDERLSDPSLDEWLVDSGATHHMATGRGGFKNRGGSSMSAVTLASGDKAPVTGRGSAVVPVHDGQHVTTITLSAVYRVPALQHNLFSVGKVDSAGGAVLFLGGMCLVFQDSRPVIESGIMAKAGAIGYKDLRGQYILGGAKNPVAEAKVASMPVTGTAVLLHRRFCHFGYDNLQRAAGMVNGINKNDVTGERVAGAICRPCAEGKLSRAPFPASTTKTSRMELLHSDTCGPFPRSLGGSTYFSTLFEPATGLLLATPIKSKGDVGGMIKARIPMLERICGDKAKRLRTDGAKKYATRNLQEWYTEKVIDLEQTLPYSPESNGVAKRVSRTIKERTRAALADANVGDELWAEAVAAAVFVFNRSPRVGQAVTPIEAFAGKRPDVSMLRVWGSKACALLSTKQQRGLKSKTVVGIMVGYADKGLGYRIFVPTSKQVIERRDVAIDETSYPLPRGVNWEHETAGRFDGTGRGVPPGSTPSNTPELSPSTSLENAAASQPQSPIEAAIDAAQRLSRQAW